MAQARTTRQRETAADAVVEALYTTMRTLKSVSVPGNPVDGACSAVLHYIRTNGPIRPTDLAAQMLLDGSTVSRHVQQLERLDLVDRERDPDDRRAFRIACTPEGVSAAEGALAARRTLLLAALQEWSAEDLEQLQQLLGRLADDLGTTATSPVA